MPKGDNNFECSPNENCDQCVLKIEQFHDKWLSFYDTSLNMSKAMKEMLKLIDDYNFNILKRIIDSSVIGIKRLNMEKNKELMNARDEQKKNDIINKYTMKISEFENRKREMEMKKIKYLVKNKPIEQCNEIMKKINHSK